MEEKKEIKFGTTERPEQESLTGFEEATPEIVALAKDLIGKFHDHIKDARILYLTIDKELKYRGKIVPGKIYKVNDREKTELNKDYTVVISLPIWEGQTAKHKEAIMDFILCHAVKDGDGGFKLIEPDFYGFYRNVERYGLTWSHELSELKKRINQMSLPFGEAG